MAITSVNDIAAAMGTSTQMRHVLKNITVPKAIGSYQSSWLGVGWPGAGTAPTAYSTGPDLGSASTTGALPYTNATTQNYIAKMSVTSSIAGYLMLYDRLYSTSNMGFAVGTYTLGASGTLPARITDNGIGCELWCEQFAAAGAASGSLYGSVVTDTGGTVVAWIPAVVSAPVIGQMQPFNVPAGVKGVNRVLNMINSATWTSGSWGITICKYICAVEVPLAGIGVTLDWSKLALPPIPSNACLFFIWQGGAATANQVLVDIDIIDK
jgi:hypothetical protein